MEEAAKELAECITSQELGWDDYLRLIFLAVIGFGAFAIAFVNWRSERNRRTTDLIRTIILDPELIAITARLRKRRDAGEDPYKSESYHTPENDLGALLNYFEVACIEIKEKTVNKRKAKRHLRRAISQADMWIGELQGLVSLDRYEKFPALSETIDAWCGDNQNSTSTQSSGKSNT